MWWFAVGEEFAAGGGVAAGEGVATEKGVAAGEGVAMGEEVAAGEAKVKLCDYAKFLCPVCSWHKSIRSSFIYS